MIVTPAMATTGQLAVIPTRTSAVPAPWAYRRASSRAAPPSAGRCSRVSAKWADHTVIAEPMPPSRRACRGSHVPQEASGPAMMSTASTAATTIQASTRALRRTWVLRRDGLRSGRRCRPAAVADAGLLRARSSRRPVSSGRPMDTGIIHSPVQCRRSGPPRPRPTRRAQRALRAQWVLRGRRAQSPQLAGRRRSAPRRRRA